MANNTINDKSKQISIRIPHDVLDTMELVKQDGESNAGFIVTAMRGEIARRQAEGSGKDPLVSSLDALARVEQIGKKAAADIGEILDVARNELQQRGIEPKG
ncbi:hypothetical protein SM021_004261 [Cronobacter muytjensii]|nr:hypothetical protein [Cronobacter muytjensii]